MKFSQLTEIDSSITLVHGDPEAFDILSISHSDDPHVNTFVFLKNKRFLNSLGSKSEQKKFLESGVLIERDYYDQLAQKDRSRLNELFAWVATLQSVNEGMSTLSKPFYDEMYKGINYQVDGRQMNTAQVDPSAEISQGVFVGEDVVIGKNVKILPGCVILPKVTIGEGTILFPNVTVYPYTAIGKNCRIHAGTTLGGDGFGYNFFNGKHQKIWHLGGVKIADDVEIGCNTMVDMGAFTSTEIGYGTKIDNDVQISHNCKIHDHIIICGKTGLAGSVEVEDYAAFGAGSGAAPGAKIQKGAQLAARGKISENAVIPAGEVVMGDPARPMKEWLKTQAILRKLSKK